MHTKRGLLTLAMLTATPLAAQEHPQYRLELSDTLRYREVTIMHMSVAMESGDTMRISLTHNALIGLSFPTADTAQAWYEELTLGFVSPAGAMRIDTREVLRQPFTLAFAPRGHVQTLATPDFPESVRQITDLTQQFDDFFLVLPGVPLEPGLTWRDTVETLSSTPDRRLRKHRTVTYRVERDTVLDDGTASVISARQVLNSSTDFLRRSTMPRMSTIGEDSGIFIFSVKQSRLLGRERSGEYAVTSYNAYGEPSSPTFRFTHSVRLVQP